jgi:uncharacterized protein (DUF486 family)
VAFLEKALAISCSYVGKELYSSLSLLALKELVSLRASSSFSLRVYIMSLVKARHLVVSFFFRQQEAIIRRANFKGFYFFFLRACLILLIVTDLT